MQAGLILVLTGIICLAVAWYLRHFRLKGSSGALLARGILNNIEVQKHGQHKILCMLSVTFTLRSGKVVHHQEIREIEKGKWYNGMPILVQYAMIDNVPEIQNMISYRQAYGNTFIIALSGILLIVAGTFLL